MVEKIEIYDIINFNKRIHMSRSDAISKMMKKTNIASTAKSIVYNKFVLYAVFVAALFDLLYSAVKQDYLYCTLFILVGFLISFFNKNMTVILTLTIAFSNILRSVIRGSDMKVEGLEGKEGANDKETTDDKEPSDDKKTKKVEESKDMKSKKENTSTLGNVASASSSNVSTSTLMSTLKEQALDLQESQQNIISGFEKIEPHMSRAESLIGSIQETAQTIQGMKNEGMK